MSVRRCPRCGRQFPSTYQQCPYCSRRRRGKRSQPAGRVDQVLAILRQNGSQIFVGGAAFFLCVALLGIILTQCSKPKPSDDDAQTKDPVQTQTVWKPLALSPGTATISVGESVTLSPSGSFDTLIWTCSNEAVVSVHNGRVTGKAAGVATVTASTGIESVSCTVTVEEPEPVSHVDLALNHTDFTIRSGEPAVQMKVRLKGTREVYDGEVVWASQDVSVVTVSETGLVTRVGRGTTTVTATADGQVLECIVRSR